MKRIVAVLALAFVGCTYEGPVRTEKATIEAVLFQPATTAVGITTNGDMHVSTVNARKSVVLFCQHGDRFVLDGDKFPRLWTKARLGAEVTLFYREIRLKEDDSLVRYETVEAE